MYSLVAARDGLPDLPWLPAWKPVDPPFSSGVSTVRLHAADLPAARAWYADLLGAEPSFVKDEYVEWRVGPHDHELGILDLRYAPSTSRAARSPTGRSTTSTPLSPTCSPGARPCTRRSATSEVATVARW